MAFGKRGSANRTYLLWLTTAITFISVISIVGLAAYAYYRLPQSTVFADPDFVRAESLITQNEHTDDSKTVSIFLESHIKNTSMTMESMKEMITFLITILIFTLVLLGSQMYMWSRDRKNLELWRESGFFCERMEFLPANRLKINNTELELNKTQIENLIKLAKNRRRGKPTHALDISDHGVQSIKRLREELGAKFIEKSLIKIRKHEGYWLEVNADNLHGIPDQ